MKVILRKDVKGIGRAHDLVTVADGHGLNHLIPAGLAVVATPSAVKNAELYQAKHVERKAASAKVFAEQLAKLAGAKVTIKAKANEQGHLYTAVGKSEIAAAVEAAGFTLPEDAIQLEKPIKELGMFEISVTAGETSGAFSLTIEAA